MDSRLIDVLLGLALVFATASLVATALQQVFDSLVSLRGRVAHRQVVSFVGDDSAFAAQLLRHPLLVSLAKGAVDDKSRRPAWIDADTMVTALLGTLVDKHAGGVRPSSPMALIHTLRQAVGADQPGRILTGSLASLVQGVEQDWPAFERRIAAWYGDVGERSVGWYKRYTQGWLIVWGLLLAAALNINPLLIAQRLWHDDALRQASAQAAIRAADAYSAAAASAASAASGAASGAASATVVGTRPRPQVAPARLAQTTAVERQIADLGERLLAALQPATRGHSVSDGSWQAAHDGSGALFALRPLLDKRRGPDDQSAAALRERLDAERAIEAQLAEVERLLPAAPAHAGLRLDFGKLREAIRAEGLALDERAAHPQVECSTVADEGWAALCRQAESLAALQRLGLPIGWGPDTKFEPFGNPLVDGLAMLLGWLVLALGCSLGAPFWFDLIKQLAKMRAPDSQPGSTPGMTASQAVSADTSTLARTTSPGEAPREPMSDALNDDERRLSEAEILRLQRALGFGDDRLSGRFDTETRQAIQAWQTQRGYPATGELTAAQIAELLQQTGAGDDGFIG